jgi:phosphomevalonate kinase
LLDATMEMKGVLFAGVPGAGGYDAVFAITLGEAARALVEEQWSARGVLALCVVEDPRGVQLEKDDPRQDGITGKMIELNLEN